MWVRMLAYEQSGGAYVGTCRAAFDGSYYSTIHESLGGFKTTFSKPGWYPRTGDSGAVVQWELCLFELSPRKPKRLERVRQCGACLQ